MRYVIALGLLLVTCIAVPVAAGQDPQQEPERVKTVDPRIASGLAQLRLDRARRAWKADGRASYSYELDVLCFCQGLKKTRIVVRRGKAPNVIPFLREQATVPRLFRTIGRAITEQASRLDVVYGERGVPTVIDLQGDSRLPDSATTYRVEFFRPLK